MTTPLLRVEDLTVSFAGDGGQVVVLQGLSFDLARGTRLALVGESGCGKSLTGLSVMGLTPSLRGRIDRGKILFAGQDLLALNRAELRKIRGAKMAMVFQDARSALNPYLRISEQLTEGMRQHGGGSERAALTRAIDLLGEVGIPDAAKRIHEYPHRFSGGMLQRIMIAMAMMTRPDLIIADEPTSALDVTIQAQTLEVLERLRASSGTAVILITHDLGVVAGRSDRLAAMYAGRIVESGATEEMLLNPAHPYMRALVEATLACGAEKGRRLQELPGQPPSFASLPSGCAFAPRCARAQDRCHQQRPPLLPLKEGRRAACWFPL